MQLYKIDDYQLKDSIKQYLKDSVFSWNAESFWNSLKRALGINNENTNTLNDEGIGLSSIPVTIRSAINNHEEQEINKVVNLIIYYLGTMKWGIARLNFFAYFEIYKWNQLENPYDKYESFFTLTTNSSLAENDIYKFISVLFIHFVENTYLKLQGLDTINNFNVIEEQKINNTIDTTEFIRLGRSMQEMQILELTKFNYINLKNCLINQLESNIKALKLHYFDEMTINDLQSKRSLLVNMPMVYYIKKQYSFSVLINELYTAKKNLELDKIPNF